MFDFLFNEIAPFESYSIQHFGPILFYAIFAVIAINYAKKKLNKDEQYRFACYISLLSPVLILAWMAHLFYIDTFDYKEDLPLFLCNVLAFIYPVVIYKRNRKALGVFYFMVLAGTAQGIITPDLNYGFPNLMFMRYWTIHCVPILLVFYSISVFKVKINFKDFINAIVWMNIYLVLIFAVNLLLKSNYAYTMRKPDAASLVDLLGPWPWYIISGELIALVMFTLLYIPYMRFKKRSLN